MKTTFTVIACLFLASCSEDEISLRAGGVMATVTTVDRSTVKGELIGLCGDSLIIAGDSVGAVPRSTLRELELNIETGRGWVAPVIILQGVPTLMFATAKSVDPIFPLIGVVVTAATWIGFEVSTPRTSFSEPMTAKDLEELSVYMRFPQGLSAMQLQALRQSWSHVPAPANPKDQP
jgi:hypothetical protein